MIKFFQALKRIPYVTRSKKIKSGEEIEIKVIKKIIVYLKIEDS